MPLTVTSEANWAQGTGASKFVKDLVLEVLRLPLTYREALFSGSSPVAGAAFYRQSSLRCRLLSQDSKLSRVRRRHESPSLTNLLIPDRSANLQPLANIFLYNFAPIRAEAA